MYSSEPSKQYTEQMAKAPILSLVICTYNNADSLGLTLDTLNQQLDVIYDNVEVVVVDNNSSDKTQSLVAEKINQSPFKIKYLFESRQGLSNARNAGVTATSGNYILFTDDDADLPSHWLANYLETIEKDSPDCVYGKIHVLWEKEKPWWYIPEYAPFFVELNYGNQKFEAKTIHTEFFGKNFCLKREFILSVGGFNPNLGRKGASLVAGEETLLYRRLISQQKKVIYIPNAGVGHRLKDREYQVDNIRKLFLDGAYTSLYLAYALSSKRLFGRPLGIPILAAKTILMSTFKMIYFLVVGNGPYRHFHHLNLRKNIRLLSLWITQK